MKHALGPTLRAGSVSRYGFADQEAPQAHAEEEAQEDASPYPSPAPATSDPLRSRLRPSAPGGRFASTGRSRSSRTDDSRRPDAALEVVMAARRTRSPRCRPASADSRGLADPVAPAGQLGTRRRPRARGRCRHRRRPAELVPRPVHGRRADATRRHDQRDSDRLERQRLDHLADAAHAGPAADQAERHVGAERAPRRRHRRTPAHRSTAAASADPPPSPPPGGMRLWMCTAARAADEPQRLARRGSSRRMRHAGGERPVDRTARRRRSIVSVSASRASPSRRRSGGSRRRARP